MAEQGCNNHPWMQDCPECVKDAIQRGMSLDQYWREVRPNLKGSHGVAPCEAPSWTKHHSREQLLEIAAGYERRGWGVWAEHYRNLADAARGVRVLQNGQENKHGDA